MVVYSVDLTKPGAPDKYFAAAFNGEIATVIVGPDKQVFKVPLEHLKHVEFFLKAFDGAFKEAEEKKIDLPEENADAFRVFLRWLYRGVDNEMLCDPQISLCVWVRTLVMADKWCLQNLALNLAKHIYNLIRIEFDPGGQKRADQFTDAYSILAEHSFRYILVHAICLGTPLHWHVHLFDRLDSQSPAFFAELARYTKVVHEAQKADKTAFDYRLHHKVTEAASAKVEKFLMPLLFQELPFPDIFASLINWCKEPEKRRDFLRNFLKM